MASKINRELVDPCINRNFADSDGIFDGVENEEDGLDDSKSQGKSDDSATHGVTTSVLQSTPVNGPPPTRESQLPSAIKSLPTNDIENRVMNPVLPKTQQRKSILSRLSSIAERSFNSPRRTKQSPPSIQEEEIGVDVNLNDENNNFNMGSFEDLPRTPSKDPEKLREARCECNSCKDAFALDTLSERTSVVSCSLASLPQSPQFTRESFGNIPIIEDEVTGTNDLYDERPTEEKNTRISDGVQRLSKFLHTTVKAGRKTLSRSNERNGYDSEDSSNTVGARSCRTFHGDETKSSRETAFLSKCLRKLASAVSIRNFGHDVKSMKADSEEGDHDLASVSNASLMFVLLPPKPGDVEIDQLIFGNDENSGSQRTLARDPALRSVLEELRAIMMSQEVVVKQASKALDECSNLVRKQSDSIIFAEQLLNIASQSYFLAECELHRLLDGGVFEPQRDRVVFEKIKLELPEFRSPAPQSYFVVLLKSGHRIKSSELICVTPKEQWLVVDNWNRLADDRSQSTECVFEFNRPDWKINIEVYFVCKQRRESLVSLDRFARFMDTRSPPSRDLGSNRSVEVRKSSFGLLGQAAFSKDDILNKRTVSLTHSHGYGPFQSGVFLEGTAYLYATVSYDAYLIVKDFNGRFGLEGQMRTFSAKLSDQRLHFFERYDNSDGRTEPRQTILLHDVREEDIIVSNDNSTYFYDFTLKLGESKESWLHLCTNSREDTDEWVHHLKLALREPCGVDLQSLSSDADHMSAEVGSRAE